VSCRADCACMGQGKERVGTWMGVRDRDWEIARLGDVERVYFGERQMSVLDG
jgi:hypothetical protein